MRVWQPSETPSYGELASCNETLRHRLAEAEAALQSLRAGNSDPGKSNVLDQKTRTCRCLTSSEDSQHVSDKSAELNRSLFTNMLNGFAFCEMHYEEGQAADFTYLEVNAAFESLTGLKDVVGKRASEVIPGIRESDQELLDVYGRVAPGRAGAVRDICSIAKYVVRNLGVQSPKPAFHRRIRCDHQQEAGGGITSRQ